MKPDSHTNQSNNAPRGCGFTPQPLRKIRCTTAMLGAAVAGIFLTVPALADEREGHDKDHREREKVDHVLLISVDGLHQSDLAWYVQTHPQSTLARSLTSRPPT
jgi:hypothetical protein